MAAASAEPIPFVDLICPTHSVTCPFCTLHPSPPLTVLPPPSLFLYLQTFSSLPVCLQKLWPPWQCHGSVGFHALLEWFCCSLCCKKFMRNLLCQVKQPNKCYWAICWWIHRTIIGLPWHVIWKRFCEQSCSYRFHFGYHNDFKVCTGILLRFCLLSNLDKLQLIQENSRSHSPPLSSVCQEAPGSVVDCSL